MDAFRGMRPQEQSPKYPGSNQVRRRLAVKQREAVENPEWARNPYRLRVDGIVTLLYGSRHLADRLGLSVRTIQKWEERQQLPKPDYRYPSTSKLGRRRLYTRSQVDGIYRIAHEERILEGKRIGNTNFVARVSKLFANGTGG